MDDYLVSIIIASYNYGHYLTEAIESTLNQTHQNIEVIVVDDGSTDNTKNVVNQYPIRYIFQGHQGVSVAKNNGIKQSKGKFFVCLDADDKFAPEYISKTIKLMKNPKVGFVRTGSIMWNKDFKIENIWMPRKIFSKYSLFAGWFGALGTVLTRRAAFDSLDYGFDTNLRALEDLDLCFRLLVKGWKTEAVFEPLHWYRIHKNSLINPKMIGEKEHDIRIINREYWFRELYRKIYALYKSTFGRAALLMTHPVEYVKGVRRKTRVNIWVRSHNWIDPQKHEEAVELFKEILITTDMLIEWSQNKHLNNYYVKQLENFESRLQSIMRSDVH